MEKARDTQGRGASKDEDGELIYSFGKNKLTQY
jgi:hypothetical protein